MAYAIVLIIERHNRRAVHRGSDSIYEREASRRGAVFIKKRKDWQALRMPPAELQELGKVLQKIMLGAPADLSALTVELREIVEKVLNS